MAAVFNMDPYKVAFLRQSQETKAGFLQQLTNSHAEVEFEGDSLTIEEEAEVAQSVIAMPHKVGGRDLDVSLYTPKKAAPRQHKSQEPAEEEEEVPLRTVVFHIGQETLESEELYELYFQSPRHGGGEVEEVEIDKEKGLVYVTFEEPAVAQRVSGKTHRIAGHQVEVRLYKPPKPRPTYPDKLLFKNIADSTTRDCLCMYLERITGLDPVEVLYGDEVGTVLVTFDEEPDLVKTAQFCMKRKLEGRQLTVTKVPISNCLLVENVNDRTTEDTVELYFENKRSGGGAVERVEMVPDENECFVFFEDHEVLDGVLQKPHKIDGAQLSVKRYMECLGQSGGSQDPTAFTAPKPVAMTNMDPYKVAFLRQSQETKAGFLQQLTNSHAEVEFEGDSLTIEEEAEVAQSVIAMPHKVGGRDLDVSLYTPKKAAPRQHKSQEPAEEEEEVPLRTVVFHIGQETLESEELYELYFQSRRHGGGEVEEVEIDKEKGLVYVTFEEPAVAQRVSGKTHRIAGHQVEVRLYKPPKPRPTYPDKLLFKNIADSTTRDCLCMYLERITGLDPVEVLYGDEVGTVLVTFDEEPDLVKTAQFCMKRKLEGRQLTVTKVPISNCLLVENVNDRTTEDTVELYFENKRSGGGAVERVEMVPDENECFVFFEDHEVLDGVLQKPHKIDGAQLSVKRYMECLGQSGGSQDPTAFTAPKPVAMTNMDPYKVAFLRQSQETKAGFLQQLTNSHAEVEFEGDSLTIACSLKPSVPKARILARTWATDVQQVAGEFLGMIDVHKRHVVQQIWPEVETAVRSANIASPKGVTFFPVPEESAFVVVGMKSMAKELLDKINTVATKVEEEIERRSLAVTETNTKLEPYKLQLLLAMGFQIETAKRHEGLRIEINVKKNSIAFHGLMKDVKESQVEMYEMLLAVTHDKITDMSDMQKKVLDSKETKPFIVQKFKADKIATVWEVGPKGEVCVHAFNDPDLVKAIHIIKKSVPEHVIQLSPESADLLLSQDWRTLVARLTSTHAGVLLIAPSHDRKQVFVTCIDSIMHNVVEEVEMFLEENTVYSQIVRFSPSRQQFIHQHRQQELLLVQGNLQAYRVLITMEEDGREILVRGTHQGLVEVRKKLEEINSKILCHVETFKEMGKVKYLGSANISKDLKMLGQANHAVVAQEPESPDLEQECNAAFGKTGGGPAVTPQVPSSKPTGNRQQGQSSTQGQNPTQSVVGSATAPSVNKTFSAPSEEKEASLYIYTDSPNHIRDVLTCFDDLVKDKFIRKEINDEILTTLTNAEMEQIYNVRNQLEVEITVQATQGRVCIAGLQNDVFDAIQKISKILRDIELQVNCAYLKETVSGTDSVDYEFRENQIIEQAYQGKKKTAEITDIDGNVFVIDFDSMMEFPKNDPSDTVHLVLRRDNKMASGAIPAIWVAHTADEHVKVVPLASSDAEYKKVESNFRATLGENRGNLTITAIDRIQNPTLYQQYTAKKSHLKKQNPYIVNEKTLWHGTGSDAINNINNYGFNRSYCGKNATVYGKGVYFAIKTNHAAHPTYSPADPAGNRRVYQCRVLVGHHVQGNQNLRVLPVRQGHIPYDSATDNPSNPSMYVIFNDTQAYPEYMVTFK